MCLGKRWKKFEKNLDLDFIKRCMEIYVGVYFGIMTYAMFQYLIELSKGTFILSLDTELAWGTRGQIKFKPSYEGTRAVIKELLELFERYQIKATWAVVGHLFLRECKPIDGVKHPELKRPLYKKQDEDWFAVDPSTDILQDPYWYGEDIVKQIKECSIPQEIGCHSFSHVVVDDLEYTDEWFSSELETCKILAQQEGVSLESFVYPENRIGRLEVLSKHGFSSYRGKDKNWYRFFPKTLRKIAHVIDNYFIVTAPVVMPKMKKGLINIPGSYFYPHKMGWAKFLPIKNRVRKAEYGIRKAAKENKVFHLWFHPFNIASDPKKLLSGIEEILKVVSELREKGLVENLTMKEVAGSLQNRE